MKTEREKVEQGLHFVNAARYNEDITKWVGHGPYGSYEPHTRGLSTGISVLNEAGRACALDSLVFRKWE